MSLHSNLCSTLFPRLEGDPSLRRREREIDGSTRFALIGLIKASSFWMVVSAILGLIASIKLHSPEYFGSSPWLTYGKVEPAFWNALVYGWLINAGLACAAWIVARLSGRPSGNSLLLGISAGAWNLAVALGLFGILRGDQRPFHMLEFPAYVAPFMIAAFIGMGVWVTLAFKARAYRSSYASQWHALAAVFAFVWIATGAYAMLFAAPAQGVFQAAAASWYASNLFGLVVAPLAFATLYYLLPKALGTPIVGYRQSAIAFWSWFALVSASGLAPLLNGPFPVWMPALGIVATFGLLLPITVFSMQFCSTLIAGISGIWDTVSVRFAFYAVVAFVVSGLLIAFGSVRGAQEVVQFSRYADGARFLFLAGFAGAAFTGGIYFILPRLVNKELPMPGLVDFQFWIQGLGIFAICVGMVLGGIQHGELMNGSVADVVAVNATSRSFLFISSLGFATFLCASIAGLVSFAWMMLSPRSAKEREAALIPAAPELEYNA